MALNVMVKSDPKGFAKGRYQCEVFERGLVLKQGKKDPIRIPVGAAATYDGKNNLTVQLEEHDLAVTVTKFGSYQNRLAKHLASFLNGKRPAPDVDAYGLPWYFYLVSILPIGIPIVTLGGAVPGALGAGLAAACFGVAQNEDWSIAARLTLCIGLVAAGYIVLAALLFAVNG